MQKAYFFFCALKKIIFLCFLSSIASAQTLTYGYDALGRVITVEDTVNGDRSFEYDPAGNRTYVSASVKPPTITPNGGAFGAAQQVSLKSDTPGAIIYYTTDGTAPTKSSQVYSAPFTVSTSSVVKAFAVKTDMKDSIVSNATFTITLLTPPTITPSGGTYSAGPVTVRLSAISGAEIYYTTNNTPPTTSSTRFTNDFQLSSDATVRAIAVLPGVTTSAEASAQFTIPTPIVATPSISPNGGTFSSGSQSVTISTATSGAAIYYTTNDTAPNASSTLYVAPFTLTGTTKLRVIAIKANMTNSAETSAQFNFPPPVVAAPTISPGSTSFANSLTVSVTPITPGSTIYYTTDGSTPTTSSSIYSASFTVNQTTTVKAIAAKTNMTTSAVVSETYTRIDTQKPTTPGIPVFDNVTSSGARVTWALSTDDVGVTGYEYALQSSTGTWTPTGTPLILSGLLPSAPYTVYIRAKDAAGNYSNWNSATFSTTNYKVASPSISPGSTNFSTSLWVSMSPVTPDSIIYYTTNGSTPTTSSEVFTSNIWITRTMTVKAIAARFGMEPSDVVSATYTFVDDIKPSAPGAPSFSSPTSSSISVSWTGATDNSGIASYEYSVYAGTTLVASQNIGLSFSTTVTGLSPSTNYTFYVKARDLAGNVGDAASAGFTTLSPPDTTPPTVPSLNLPTSVTTTGFSISWSASTDNGGVAGYRYSIDGSNWSSTGSTSASFTGLVAGAYVAFQVKAYDAANNESGAASAQVRLGVAPPGALDLRSRSSTTGDIYWVASNSANLAGYEYRINSGAWNAASASPVFLTGLTASTTYSIEVRAKNTMGDYSNSSSGSLTTIMATLPAPTGAGRIIVDSCRWEASWNAVPGATSYQVRDTNSNTQTVYDTKAYVHYCSTGSSSSNMPKSVKACNANGCGLSADFTN